MKNAMGADIFKEKYPPGVFLNGPKSLARKMGGLKY